MAQQKQPTPFVPSSVMPPAPLPLYPCHVKVQPSQGLSVTFQISVMDADRLRRKSGKVDPEDLARYIHENILKSAISTFLY